MTIALGIDTGGTYTDAVLVEKSTGKVLASAKALTTRHDLFIGIRGAIKSVFRTNSSHLTHRDVTLVSLSTTLATNAIAEGYGGRVSLLLIGYDEKMMIKHDLQKEMVTDDVVYLRGGHDLQGNEIAPLDEEAARKAILTRRDQIDAFAISGYFGTRNTAHELQIRKLVEELTCLPVTCGHDLTTRLNAVCRAVTVTLNAGLIPLLQALINDVRRTLEEMNINAPLMIVKGDGSMVRAEWALRRPIETILSGPAASAIGARHLSGCQDVWVVDMGGTTTDIALLRNGRPRITPEGARVGGRRTMIEAVDVHTVGLGGDSHVDLDSDRRLLIGPKRVVPLCLLANDHPEILVTLKRQAVSQQWEKGVAQFAISWRIPSNNLSDKNLELLNLIKAGPLALLAGDNTRDNLIRIRRIEQLEKICAVHCAGFTPTDALHVLTDIGQWNSEASRLGAEILSAQTGMSVPDFCRRVVTGVSEKVARAIVGKVIEDQVGKPDWKKEKTASTLLYLAIGRVANEALDCKLTLKQPVVALGAPIGAYMPAVAENLNTKLIIPVHAEVANAVGAVVGSIVQSQRVVISMLEESRRFRVHLPEGIHDFEDLEEAVKYTKKTMTPRIEAIARQAGAERTEVEMIRKDHRGKLAAGWTQEIFLDTELLFTAVGRPGR